EHVVVRKPPVAPGEEACEIGLEIARGEPKSLECGIASEQHAAVPDVRLLALPLGKMRRYLGAPGSRERPVVGLDLQIERRDAADDWLHAGAYFPSFVCRRCTLLYELRKVKTLSDVWAHRLIMSLSTRSGASTHTKIVRSVRLESVVTQLLVAA